MTRADLIAAGYKIGSWGRTGIGPNRGIAGPTVELWSNGRDIVMFLAKIETQSAGRGWWRFPLLPACWRYWRTLAGR